MQKPIYKIIGYTEKEYDHKMFQLMFLWAEIYSQGSLHKTQILLANAQINRWFLQEFAKLVKQFKQELKANEVHYKTTVKDRRHQFLLTVDKINDIYPSALITRVKVKQTQVKKATFNYN